MFSSIFGSDAVITAANAVICGAVSLVLGFVLALVNQRTDERSTKSMFLTVCATPLIVQAVIMLVNGKLGAGIAVMGAFSLVRFRSAQGSGRDIAVIFASTAVGLACGMGYVAFAAVIAAAFIAVLLLVSLTPLGEPRCPDKQLRITIPESLEYDTVFDDLFRQYLSRCTLQQVKTSNMGSMFELKYLIRLSDSRKEKEFIDALRCRNGNLPISVGVARTSRDEL